MSAASSVWRVQRSVPLKMQIQKHFYHKDTEKMQREKKGNMRVNVNHAIIIAQKFSDDGSSIQTFGSNWLTDTDGVSIKRVVAPHEAKALMLYTRQACSSSSKMRNECTL